MKLMKKALAMFLAAVMVFSTMAVGASAANNVTDPELEISLKFFRKVGGAYVEATKVMPGEDVYLRVYINTNYNVANSDMLIFYDKQFLAYQNSLDSTDDKNLMNPSHAYVTKVKGANFTTNPASCGLILDAIQADLFTDENAVAYGYEDLDDMFSKVGLQTIAITVKTGQEAPLSRDEYIFELPFKVKDAEGTPKSGLAIIPADLVMSSTKPDNPITISLRDIGNPEDDYWTMDFFTDENAFGKDCDVTTGSAELSVESNIIFDANGGKIDGVDMKSIPGVIGDTFAGEIPTPTLSKHICKGWSLSDADDATPLTVEEISNLTYDYDDITLYAVWEEFFADVAYNINVYMMDTNGSYPTTPTTTQEIGKDAQEIEHTPVAVPGFTVDEESSTLEIVLDEDSASEPSVGGTKVNEDSIDVYYKRNQHSVTYLDEKGETLWEELEVYFGAQIPDLPDGYEVPGKDVTWTRDPAGEGNTMPDEDVVFQASLEAIPYTYIFNAVDTANSISATFSNGAAGKIVTYYYDDIPADPKTDLVIPTGYEFDKWVEVPITPSVVEFDGSAVRSDKSYEARYKLIDYTVTFSKLGADGVTKTTVYEYSKNMDDEISIPALPTPAAGLNIDGWNYNGSKYNEGDVFTMPAADVEFIATEGDIIYTYTFNSGIGKFSDNETTREQSYTYNQVPALPTEAIVAPDGYIFTSWSPELPENVTEDKTFTAQYSAIPYTLTYTIENAPAGVTAPATVSNLNINSEVTIANLPVATGYTITGWTIKGTEETVAPGSTFLMPAANVELVAKVEVEKFKINFYDVVDGSDVAIHDSIELEFGEAIPELPEASKLDYEFVRWEPKAGQTLGDTMPANDVDLYAVWERKSYSITYVYDNTNYPIPTDAPAIADVIAGFDTNSISGEEIEVANAPSLAGYTFIGWSYNGVVVDKFTMPMNNVELKGEWQKNGGYLAFYLAKNEDGTPVGEPVWKEWRDEGADISSDRPADPSIEGSTFLGWVDKDGNALPSTMPNGNVNAFAKLELNKHSVTYYDSDGTTILEQFTDVTYGSETPKAADPVAPAHTDPLMEFYFAGWNEAIPAVMPDEDLEFTATYGERLKGTDHLAIYKSDGKTIETFKIHAGNPMQKPADPTKFGYKFVGWEPEVPDVMPDYDITFEAVWESDMDFNPVIIGGVVVAGAAIATIAAVNTALITGAAIIGGVVVITGIHHVIEHSYNVTYKVNGEVYRTFRIIEGTRIIVPKDPTKEGATFKGWNPEVPERMPAHDLVFEAVWSDSNPDNPATGSTSAGLVAFAAISSAAVAAYLVSKKKKEDEE